MIDRLDMATAPGGFHNLRQTAAALGFFIVA
jgi:hypothetical protein